MPFNICIAHKSFTEFTADFQFGLNLQRLQCRRRRIPITR